MELALRPGVATDYESFVELFAELRIPDPIPTREQFAAEIAELRVACADGAETVVGFVRWRAYGPLAHIIQLVVAAHLRGQRIGERLLEEARTVALAAGCTRWYLNVKRDNAAAIRLYERCGFAFELDTFVLRLPWDRVGPIAPGVRATLADPIEDAPLAAQFRLPVERLAAFRARGMHVIALREAGAVVGFTAFSPGYSGTPLLCAVRPELGASVVAACRPYADFIRFNFIRVAVEGDRAVADALIAQGAEVTFEILRLSAPLLERASPSIPAC